MRRESDVGVLLGREGPNLAKANYKGRKKHLEADGVL
jgi:hypothetical protein